jgi:hypothetical protein
MMYYLVKESSLADPSSAYKKPENGDLFKTPLEDPRHFRISSPQEFQIFFEKNGIVA